jgi:hypothetical protein
MPCRHCIRANSRRVFAVHTSRMQAGVFTCRGHQPMLEIGHFGAAVWRLSRGVNLLSWYESRVAISVGNGHRPTPTAQDNAQLVMLDRFASELPTSMWKPRRAQCLPSIVVYSGCHRQEVAFKSRCDRWLPRITTRRSSSSNRADAEHQSSCTL